MPGSGFPAANEATPNNPEDFGLLGWTSDPLLATSNATPALGAVLLARFRAAKSGLLGRLVYTVTTAGAVLSAGENFVGVYDTGQALAGSATLLGVSADQSANFGVAATYAAAMVTPPAIVAGQDYLAAILANGTTAPTIERASTSGALSLWNYSLVGLSLRTATALAGQTALPATIAAGSIGGGGASFVFLAAP